MTNPIPPASSPAVPSTQPEKEPLTSEQNSQEISPGISKVEKNIEKLPAIGPLSYGTPASIYDGYSGPKPIQEKSLELLKNNRGIAYGETHSSSATQDWVRSNLEIINDKLVKYGSDAITTLFLELQASDKNIIDSFVNGNIDKETLINSKIYNNPAPIASLIVEAKRLNIEIVPIDIPIPNDQSYNLEKRLEDSNKIWANRIDEHMSGKSGKFVLICGYNHTLSGSRTTNMPRLAEGVDSLLSIPSIDIFTPITVRDFNLQSSYQYSSPNMDYDTSNNEIGIFPPVHYDKFDTSGLSSNLDNPKIPASNFTGIIPNERLSYEDITFVNNSREGKMMNEIIEEIESEGAPNKK